MRRRFLLSALTLIAMPHAISHAAARMIDPGNQTECSFGAFVTETDPAGLNVHSGPGLHFPVVGHLPPVITNSDDPSLKAKVEVNVKAGANGWFLISDARDNEALTNVARPIFSGTGWVSGSRLTVKSQAEHGHAEPDESSPVVLSIRDETLDTSELTESGRLQGCKDSWAFVEYGPLPKESEIMPLLTLSPLAPAGKKPGSFRAWVNKICALQETSCSGF